MTLHIDNNWLRKRIECDPDMELEAAAPELLLSELGFFMHEGLVKRPSAKAGTDTNTEATGGDNVVSLAERIAERDVHYAFGRYVHLKRREKGWALSDLATRAQIDESQLRAIERDPYFVPRPRTVFNLASCFNDDPKKLMRLAGVVKGRDADLEEAALRFAAMSDDLGQLNKEERALLNEFVKLLRE